jgi:hypothetical protein
MFEKHCSGSDLKNILSVIVRCVLRKTVNAGFSFRSCLLTVHAFTRIKVTRIKIKLCGIFWTDWSTMCIHLWSFQKDPWVVSSSIRTINQSLRFSILTTTFKLEMNPMFSIALCIEANQHKTKKAKNKLELAFSVIKQIKQVLLDNQEGEPSFGEGLSRVLSGLNAATTRIVISATMAHHIPCNGGSRFVFLHTFSDLLVGQMEATLEGQDINVRIQSNKLQNKITTWPDSLADDYIHHPIDNKLD